jgi:hypothetical protein
VLGRSSWTHPRRDAFLQRYITLKAARELDEAARTQVVACIDRMIAGSAVEAEREQLLAFGAQAAQLASDVDVTSEVYAEPGASAALLQVCQTLLQPLMDDMSQLRPALQRAAAENEDLARRLESRRVQLEVLEQRQRSIKAKIRQRQQVAACKTPPIDRRPIGRRPWPISAPAAAASPGTAELETAHGHSLTAELSLSKALLLFPVPASSSSLSEWVRGEDTDHADAPGSVVCSGTWTLHSTTEPGFHLALGTTDQAVGLVAPRSKWTGENTWSKR